MQVTPHVLLRHKKLQSSGVIRLLEKKPLVRSNVRGNVRAQLSLESQIGTEKFGYDEHWRRRRCASSDGVGAGDVIDAQRHEVGLFLKVSIQNRGRSPYLFTAKLRFCLTSGTSRMELLRLFDSLMECGPFIGVLSNIWCFVFRHFVV